MYLSIEEIDQKYDGEWIYLINPQTIGSTVLGGEVLAHSPCRENVIRVMMETDNESVYIKYAGKVPEGMSVLL